MEPVWRYDVIELAEDDPPRCDAGETNRLADPDHPERIRSDAAVESNPANRSQRRSSASRAGESDSDRPLSPTAGVVWTPVIPTVLTLLGLLLGVLYGFDLFDLSAPGRGRLVAYSLLVPYFIVAVNGTLWIFDDAAHLRATDAPWQPTPWLYAVGGALILELVMLWPLVVGNGSTENVASVLGGALLVNFFLSTVVVGPVYLLQRHRKLGVP